MTRKKKTKSTNGSCEKVFNYRARYMDNSIILLGADTLMILISVLISADILFRLRGVAFGAERLIVLVPFWWVGSLWARLTPGWGVSSVEKLRRTVLLLVALFLMLIAGRFIARVDKDPSRIAHIAAFFLCAGLLPIGRLFAQQYMQWRGIWGLPVVVYGNDQTAAHAVRAMRDDLALGYIPLGIFDDQQPTGSEIGGVPVLGDLFDRTAAAPVAVLAAPAMETGQVARLMEGPLRKYRRVIILPEMLDVPTLWVMPCDFLGVLGLEMSQNLLNPLARLVKYWVEWLVTLVTFPLWGALLAGLALGVWATDFKSPIFRQTRIGFHGRRFRLLKFRTMHVDAESILRTQLAENEELRQEWEANCKLREDPRVTRMGHFLRQTSLDELPQLFHVLMGKMSLVGPRPLPPYHHERLPERTRMLRERVRPGLTGLWQVSGRSETGDEGLERWDSYYVRNWSFWLDLVILARTVSAVLQKRGAY